MRAVAVRQRGGRCWLLRGAHGALGAKRRAYRVAGLQAGPADQVDAVGHGGKDAVHARRAAGVFQPFQRFGNGLGLALMGSATEPGGPGAVLYRATARLWELAGPERVQWLHEQTLGRAADGRVWTAIHAQGGESFGAVRDAWTQVMDNCGSHQLRQVRCPVLVLGGAWDQLHLQAARFAAAAPNGQAITAPRRTHQWPLTHPDEVAASLRHWVAELPAHHAGPAAQAPATTTATAGG